MYVYVMIRNACLVLGMMLNGTITTTHVKLDLIKDSEGEETLRDKLYLSLRNVICSWEEFPLPKRKVDGPIGFVAGYNPFLSLLKFEGKGFPAHWPKALLKAVQKEAKSLFLRDRDVYVPGEEQILDQGFADPTNPEVFVPVWMGDNGNLGESLPLDEDGFGQSNVVLDKFTEWVAATLDYEVDLNNLQHMDDYGRILKQYAALKDGRSRHVGMFDLVKGWVEGKPHMDPKRDDSGRFYWNDSRGNKRYYDKAVDMLVLYCTTLDWNFLSQGKTVSVPYCLKKFWQFGKVQAQEKAVAEICTYRGNMVQLVKTHAFNKRVKLAKSFMTKSQKEEVENFIRSVKTIEVPKEFA